MVICKPGLNLTHELCCCAGSSIFPILIYSVILPIQVIDVSHLCHRRQSAVHRARFMRLRIASDIYRSYSLQSWLMIGRAILFANVIATSIRGFARTVVPATSLGGSNPASQFRRVIAPVMTPRRMSACPIFAIGPSRAVPPDECWRGARSSQTIKSRTYLKQSIGCARASIAGADSGITASKV